MMHNYLKVTCSLLEYPHLFPIWGLKICLYLVTKNINLANLTFYVTLSSIETTNAPKYVENVTSPKFFYHHDLSNYIIAYQ